MHFFLLILALAVTALGFPTTLPCPDLTRLQTSSIFDEGINRLHAKRCRMAPPGTTARPPEMQHLWEVMDKANVSIETQQYLESYIQSYANIVVNQGYTPGGPSNGINNTAINYLKRMTYSGLYHNFTTEFMESIVHLQRRAMKDIKGIDIARQFLEDLEFREKSWTTGLDQLSLEANDVIAWLNEVNIATVDRIYQVRQIFEDAIRANPSVGDTEYGGSFFSVKMNPESDWLVDYESVLFFPTEKQQALKDNREIYDALIRSGLDKANPSLFEEELVKVVSNYTLGADMTSF